MIVRYLLVSSSVLFLVLICCISFARKSEDRADRAYQDMARLHDLISALLGLQTLGRSSQSLPHMVMQIFELEYCAIYLPSEHLGWHRFSASQDEPFHVELCNLTTLIDEYESGVRYHAVKIENTTTAIIAVKPGTLSWETIETIASVLALALESSLDKNGFAKS